MLKKETLSENEFVLHYIRASKRENRSSRFSNNKGVDQPAHSRRQINVFVIRCLQPSSLCSGRDCFESRIVKNLEDSSTYCMYVMYLCMISCIPK